MRHLLSAVIAATVLVSSGVVQAQTPKGPITYKDHILPLFRKHCLNCHNADKASADLNVATYQALMAGGASGEAIKPGSPDSSLLFKLTAHAAEPRMPPKSPKIPDADLALLKTWIEGGAPETAVGAAKSAARKVDIDPMAGQVGKPSGPPPMPTKLPEITLPRVERPHPVTALAASPWAPLLAVAGHERVLLYNSDTMAPIGALAFPERIPTVLRFSRNGKWLLAAGGRGAAQGKVVIWDVTSGSRITEIGDEADMVLAADISPDQKLVALGGPGKLIKVFDTATGAMKYKIKKHTDWVTAIEFSPDGNMLATGDRNGGAFVWEAATGGIIFTLGDHKDSVNSLNWRGDSQMLATASEDGKLILWYAEDGFPTRTVTAQAETGRATTTGRPGKPIGVQSVAYSRTGLIATCGRDKTARIWRADGNQQARLEGFTDLPTRVAFSHDGERLFVGDFTGVVRAFATKDGKAIGELGTK